jgi:hypothetical protein
MDCLMHGADHGVSVIAKPRRTKRIDQLHALRMIASCRADWNGDAALPHVSRRADVPQFSCRAAEVPRCWRGR